MSFHDFPALSETESAKLTEMCQRNGWLRRGGYMWQDDPFLPEWDFPYNYIKASDVEGLTDYFEHGNWAIRSGIVYKDLAFIQQDGGDEWWTLKRGGEDWVPFESVSCGMIIEDSRERFYDYIRNMRAATVDECKRLDYMHPKALSESLGERAERATHAARSQEHNRIDAPAIGGGSGSGKTFYGLLPNIMQMSCNYFITDPKGQALPMAGQMLADGGYTILSFNTIEFSKSLHYNPLAYVRDEADILEFVACLIDNTTGDSSTQATPSGRTPPCRMRAPTARRSRARLGARRSSKPSRAARRSTSWGQRRPPTCSSSALNSASLPETARASATRARMSATQE